MNIVFNKIKDNPLYSVIQTLKDMFASRVI